MTTRRCIRCKQAKGIADMHRTKLRIYNYCKKCLYQLQMLRWNRQKARAVAHLGGQCKGCGFKGHPALFDFDHREPSDKEFGWNRLRLRSWDSIKKELDKCELLCALCHRLRHLNPALWPAVEKEGKE